MGEQEKEKQAGGVTPPEKQAKYEGKVKWFSDQKGYGFIAQENSADVFVHHSAIQMEGFRTLKEGESVCYDLLEGDKGLQAVNVMRVEA